MLSLLILPIEFKIDLCMSKWKQAECNERIELYSMKRGEREFSCNEEGGGESYTEGPSTRER